ncbi:MAG: hypothetical protein WC517_00635 [Patescibacteria group bacterium]
MNTKIIVGLVAAAVIAGGALLMAIVKPGSRTDSACAAMCQKAYQACPSLINEGDCNNRCANLSEESKKHLSEASSCEELSAKPELIADLLIPEVDSPAPADSDNASACETACGNYVAKCLTLVPNATQALFDDGLNSCLEECASWSAGKVDCLAGALDCEAMTNVCGL